MAVHRQGKLIVPAHVEQAMEDELERQGRAQITCDRPQKLQIIKCPDCNNKVAIHCDECKQHVSGCTCDLKARMKAVGSQIANWSPHD